VVYGVTETYDQESGQFFLIPSERDFRPASLEGLARWCSLVPSSVAVRREAFWACGGFPAVGFGEDWLFSLSLAKDNSFGFVDRVVTRRLLHRESICMQVDQATLESFAQTLCELVEGWSGCDHISRLPRLHLELIRTCGHRWSSVQKWYLAALDAGILDMELRYAPFPNGGTQKGPGPGE